MAVFTMESQGLALIDPSRSCLRDEGCAPACIRDHQALLTEALPLCHGKAQVCVCASKLGLRGAGPWMAQRSVDTQVH